MATPNGSSGLGMSRARTQPAPNNSQSHDWIVHENGSNSGTNSVPDSPLLSPKSARRSVTAGMTEAELNAQASQLIFQAFHRSSRPPTSPLLPFRQTHSPPPELSTSTTSDGVYRPQASRPINSIVPARTSTPPPVAFGIGKLTFGLMRGRSLSKARDNKDKTEKDKTDSPNGKDKKPKSRSRNGRQEKHSTGAVPPVPDERGRTRSVSPFFSRRSAAPRARSPSVGPLRADSQSDVEGPISADNSATSSPVMRNFLPLRGMVLRRGSDNVMTERDEEEEEDYDDGSVAGSSVMGDGEDEDDELEFDDETQRNTVQNTLTTPTPETAIRDDYGFQTVEQAWAPDHDPLGEGVNIVIPPRINPLFQSKMERKNKKRKKETTVMEPLKIESARPVFVRDRCSLTLTQGAFTPSGRRYIVATDRSEESRYALEWAIGTVIRDGDELYVVTVVETDTKLDPPSNTAQTDRVAKLRNQQERQTLVALLSKDVTGLLQRTRLQVSVTCQAWHAKNSRHMLLDIVDYYEPLMLIVGSRGVGQLKGILLGSTAHYLIQKSSVPVMVARRRLKRPSRRTAHLAPARAPRVPLSQAAIDKTGAGRDADVVHMRDELRREEEEELARRSSGVGPGSDDGGDEEESDEDEDGAPTAKKVAGA